MSKQKIAYLTVEEISALLVLAGAVIESGGEVKWALPVSEEWLDNLKTASKKLDQARGDD